MASDLVLQGAGSTDRGRRRSHNEDALLIRNDLQLYAVADGAGGHNSGEVASALALRSLENYFGATVRKTYDLPEFDRLGIPHGARRLSSGVLKANRDIIAIAKSRPEHRGMGTTLVAAAFSPRSGLMHVAHVGDSRFYRLRAGHLELLTQDHSLATDVLEQRPDLDDEVLERLPKNIVTRALGMDPELRVSLRSYAVANGDRYLLCTDGLSGPVPAEQLAAALAKAEPPEKVCQELIRLANDAGGPDNIGVVVIDCKAGPARAVPRHSPPPPPLRKKGPARLREASDPELLILAIEDLDLRRAVDSASDDLLKALTDLVGKEHELVDKDE